MRLRWSGAIITLALLGACTSGSSPQGDDLPTGRWDIAVGVTGPSPGSYPAAGVTLTILDRGGRYQATAWGGGVACVVRNINAEKQTGACDRASDPEISKMDDFIHQQ